MDQKYSRPMHALVLSTSLPLLLLSIGMAQPLIAQAEALTTSPPQATAVVNSPATASPQRGVSSDPAAAPSFIIDAQKAKAYARGDRDRLLHSREQLDAAEKLYQIANQKWRSPEAKTSLEKFIKTFPKDLNRFGSALVYLGQLSEGQEAVRYFKEAYQKHGDSFYYDGVQVGPYARFLLAEHYVQDGQPDLAKELYQEIWRDFPEAIDHQGLLLSKQTATLAKTAPLVANAYARSRKDRAKYPAAKLNEAESLYQVANHKWDTPEATAALEKFVASFPTDLNRTGCALLYLGQLSDGDEKVKYFKEAIEHNGDSYYLDGVQVGAYGRVLLGEYYLKNGRSEEADALFAEVRHKFPTAIDHEGRSLLQVINGLKQGNDQLPDHPINLRFDEP